MIVVKRIFVEMDYVEYFSFVLIKIIYIVVNIIFVKVFCVKIMGYVLNMELNIFVSVRQDGKENFVKKQIIVLEINVKIMEYVEMKIFFFFVYVLEIGLEIDVKFIIIVIVIFV